ncbi:hypothetical protein ACH4SP_28225 [Streptomyces sp. NPDC021093]|uniref:hypothetical protein n=1 Tax=Streptomyces sp. NPDC021093 TaxID=3365112 RepID=UPI0037A1C31A
MCNPRRIRVRATREVAVAWEQETRRRVVRTAEATGTAQVREPLRGSVGAPTLAALPGVLARTAGWEETEDGFRFTFDGGWVAYRQAEAELEIVAAVSAEVEAAGEATETVRGEVTGTIEAEGLGVYDDDWGRSDRTSAWRQAHADAEAALTRETEERVRSARREAESNTEGAAREAAAGRAETALAAAARERERELREQAAARLAAVGVLARNLFHRALADAYRDALLAYARSRGAEFIRCEESDGVLEIDFELQI